MTGKHLSLHFTDQEFACHCCGKLPEHDMNPALLELLENARSAFKQPIVIMSGYRCPKHNAEVGGAKHSQHMLGNAADIRVHNVSPADVHNHFSKWHEGGLGRYDTFTHVDVRGTRVRWDG